MKRRVPTKKRAAPAASVTRMECDTGLIDYAANLIYDREHAGLTVRWLALAPSMRRTYLNRAKKHYLAWVTQERDLELQRRERR